MIYIDFSKAFDSIDHWFLLYALGRLGVGNPLLSWNRSYLRERRQFLSYFGKSSDLFQASSGVPQCSYLGPLLFYLFINTMFSAVSPCRLFIFDDVFKIFHMISLHNDCLTLHITLDKLTTYNTFDLFFNISNDMTTILADSIQRTNQVQDLGILFLFSFNFSPENDITRKSFCVLGSIKRHSINFSWLIS